MARQHGGALLLSLVVTFEQNSPLLHWWQHHGIHKPNCATKCEFHWPIRVKVNNKEQVKEQVFLRMVLDKHLTWRSHVAHVANKISKSIGIIRKSSFYLKNDESTHFALFYDLPVSSILQPRLDKCVSLKPFKTGNLAETNN